MFNFAENNEQFNKIIGEYISQAYENNNDDLTPSYKMGAGWPNFTLDDIEKATATGLDGEEYGFNPNKINMNLWGKPIIKAKMPDFEDIASHSPEETWQEKIFTAADYAQAQFKTDMLDADIEHMYNLSDSVIMSLMPAINDVINEFDYEGSPLLDSELDRSFLAQLVDLAIEKASVIEETQVIFTAESANPWEKQHLLRCVMESMVLMEVFCCRRPNYRRVLGHKQL